MQKPLVVSLAVAGLAFANYHDVDRLSVSQAQWLSTSEVTWQIAVPGYQVHDIEVESKTCEFEVTNSAGARIEGRVHPAAGEAVERRVLCCLPCPAGRLNVPQAQWLSTSEITLKLSAQGYRVHEIEVSDGAYEFEATTSTGARIEAHAHPVTGEVLRGGLLCCDRCLEV